MKSAKKLYIYIFHAWKFVYLPTCISSMSKYISCQRIYKLYLVQSGIESKNIGYL